MDDLLAVLPRLLRRPQLTDVLTSYLVQEGLLQPEPTQAHPQTGNGWGLSQRRALVDRFVGQLLASVGDLAALVSEPGYVARLCGLSRSRRG